MIKLEVFTILILFLPRAIRPENQAGRGAKHSFVNYRLRFQKTSNFIESCGANFKICVSHKIPLDICWTDLYVYGREGGLELLSKIHDNISGETLNANESQTDLMTLPKLKEMTTPDLIISQIFHAGACLAEAWGRGPALAKHAPAWEIWEIIRSGVVISFSFGVIFQFFWNPILDN